MRLTSFAGLTTALLLAAARARADEGALPPLPPDVAVAPDGALSVSRTPSQGVDVHAATAAGTVSAWGCARVDVVPPGAAAPPCPYAGPPAALAPRAGYATQPPPRARYAPDPARSGALLASSLVFGLGTAAAGSAYMISRVGGTCATSACEEQLSRRSTPALLATGVFLTLPASAPRLVVGDTTGALVWSGLRGGSFALGTLVDWNDRTQVLPATLAFVIPVTLSIVDLARTPHREDLAPAPSEVAARARVRLDALGPTVAVSATGQAVPAFGALGRF